MRLSLMCCISPLFQLQHLAISCIQRNVKKFMAIRDWSWWKLYTKVQPLLNVHRTEEELKNKDVSIPPVMDAGHDF